MIESNYTLITTFPRIQFISGQGADLDLNSIYYHPDLIYLIQVNQIVTYSIYAIMILGLSWCLAEYLDHRNDPIIFEEFSNLNRWNLPQENL